MITRTLLFVALITAAACSSTSIYPVPNLGHVDAGDSTQDGGDSHPTLMQFYVPGDEDGGPTGVKLPDGAVVSTRDEDGGMAGSTPTPDSGVATHTQPDAGAQGSADAGPPAKQGTCGSCQTDADCLVGYVCSYASKDGVSECFLTAPTPDCAGAPGGMYLAAQGAPGSTIGSPLNRCLPYTPHPDYKPMTCAQWHTATGL